MAARVETARDLEPRQHARDPVEASPRLHRVEVRADHEGRPRACPRPPPDLVAGGVDRGNEAGLGHPARQPLARRPVLVGEGAARVRTIGAREGLERAEIPGEPLGRRLRQPGREGVTHGRPLAAAARGPHVGRTADASAPAIPASARPAGVSPWSRTKGRPRSAAAASRGSNGTRPRKGRPCWAAVASPPGPSKSGPTVPHVGHDVAGHVLDQPEEPRPALAGECHGAAHDQVGDAGGNRDHDRAGQPGQEIEERRQPIGARREVDEENVERAPGGVGQELTEGRALHGPAPGVGLGLGGRVPHDGRVVAGQEQVHRQDANPLGGDGRLHAIPLDPKRLAAHAQHLAHRGAVEVRVEDAHPEPAPRERPREVRGDRALADAALAGDHRHAGADRGHPGGEPRLLRDDLLHDVRAAVARDVAIALHVSLASMPPAARASTVATARPGSRAAPGARGSWRR